MLSGPDNIPGVGIAGAGKQTPTYGFVKAGMIHFTKWLAMYCALRLPRVALSCCLIVAMPHLLRCLPTRPLAYPLGHHNSPTPTASHPFVPLENESSRKSTAPGVASGDRNVPPDTPPLAGCDPPPGRTDGRDNIRANAISPGGYDPEDELEDTRAALPFCTVIPGPCRDSSYKR